MELLISLIAGAVGGNAVGGVLRNLNLGVIGNSLTGIVGGGIGGQLLAMLGAPDLAGAAGEAAGLDIGTILGQVGSGAVGGGALMAVIGVVKNAMGK
ncbi:MAG: hypothetical protein QNJ16_12200 [Rhodobacter sp.]|nr:hypothetical protein [Rhodobacter sp.]